MINTDDRRTFTVLQSQWNLCDVEAPYASNHTSTVNLSDGAVIAIYYISRASELPGFKAPQQEPAMLRIALYRHSHYNNSSTTLVTMVLSYAIDPEWANRILPSKSTTKY